MKTTERLVHGSPVDVDPRDMLDANALVVASRNTFPVVARHVQRRDRFGVAAGSCCALLLGALTFWSMSSQRPLPVPAPVAPVTIEPEPVQPPVQIAALPQPAPAVPVDPMTSHLTSPALILDLSSVPAAPSATASATSAAKPKTGEDAAGAAKAAPRSPQQPLSADESFADRIGSRNTSSTTSRACSQGRKPNREARVRSSV